MVSRAHFLVISLGNPAPYLDTLHSAGHLALQSLQRYLGPEQPPFQSFRRGKISFLASDGPRYTMLQSPTLMNVSGPWVLNAWKETLAGKNLVSSELTLVLVHDDLEENLGVIKTRHWSRSHRGHNGVKSVNSSMASAGVKGSGWARISVGIGRPQGREKADVSDFVLRRMTKLQQEAIQEHAGPGLFEALEAIEASWRRDAGAAAG